MSQFNTSGEKGYVATAALGDGVIVKLSSGQVVVATAGADVSIGVIVGATAAGGTANVRLRSAQGTLKVQAGGTVAVGDAVTATAAGKAITTVVAANQILGYALEAGVSGDMIEVMPSTAKV